MAGIFLFQDERLIALEPQLFQSEDEFQTLLANQPNLLAGDRADAEGNPRLLLVRREMGIPGEELGGDRWSVDHLFLDQDGLPTLVEVKRSTDTRIRRELVGQMLDYAANAVAYWPAKDIRAGFEARCAADGLDPERELSAFLSDEDDPDAFWERVSINLQARRLRLLFVADAIPAELRRIVEFLNEQMSPAEVLALELKQYANGSVRTFVPRLFGQTTEAERKKTAPRATATWNEASFFGHVDLECAPPVAAAVRHIYEWGRARHETRWGKGAKFPATHVVDHGSGTRFAEVGAGWMCMIFSEIRNLRPFDEVRWQNDLLGRLNAVPGVNMPEYSFDTERRQINLDNLPVPEGAEQLLNVLHWMSEQLNGANGEGVFT